MLTHSTYTSLHGFGSISFIFVLLLLYILCTNPIPWLSIAMMSCVCFVYICLTAFQCSFLFSIRLQCKNLVTLRAYISCCLPNKRIHSYTKSVWKGTACEKAHWSPFKMNGVVGSFIRPWLWWNSNYKVILENFSNRSPHFCESYSFSKIVEFFIVFPLKMCIIASKQMSPCMRRVNRSFWQPTETTYYEWCSHNIWNTAFL